MTIPPILNTPKNKSALCTKFNGMEVVRASVYDTNVLFYSQTSLGISRDLYLA